MKKEELIQRIEQRNPLLADAVNTYLRSVHADGDGTISENDIVHRRIATQKITINAIRVLDHDQLNRLQDVLNHIAADREIPYTGTLVWHWQVADQCNT